MHLQKETLTALHVQGFFGGGVTDFILGGGEPPPPKKKNGPAGNPELSYDILIFIHQKLYSADNYRMSCEVDGNSTWQVNTVAILLVHTSFPKMYTLRSIVPGLKLP